MSQIVKTKLLLDKFAIVTGCNRGIGYAISKNFLLQGAHVIGCSQQISERLKTEMSSFGKTFTMFNLTLKMKDQLRKLLKQ